MDPNLGTTTQRIPHEAYSMKKLRVNVGFVIYTQGDRATNRARWTRFGVTR